MTSASNITVLMVTFVISIIDKSTSQAKYLLMAMSYQYIELLQKWNFVYPICIKLCMCNVVHCGCCSRSYKSHFSYKSFLCQEGTKFNRFFDYIQYMIHFQYRLMLKWVKCSFKMVAHLFSGA